MELLRDRAAAPESTETTCVKDGRGELEIGGRLILPDSVSALFDLQQYNTM